MTTRAIRQRPEGPAAGSRRRSTRRGSARDPSRGRDLPRDVSFCRGGSVDTEGTPIERELRRRLCAVGPIARAELLRVLTMSRKKRALRIGALYQLPTLQTSAELLMDIEDDPAARAIVLAELRIMEREDG